MKIQVEEISRLERKLMVDIPVEKVNETYGQIYKSIQKEYHQPGFRKGKVPLQIIKKRFADKVDQDALEYLIGPAWVKALQEKELEPVMNPKFEHPPVKENNAFSFTATFEVKPPIELKQIEGIELQREKVEITEENINDVLQSLRKNKAVSKAVEEPRPAQMGDIAVVDFEGFLNGEAIEGGKADGHELELGSAQFIEGFEEGVVGMKAGEEKELQLRFPEAYHAQDLAGQEVTFKIRLQQLKAMELPELNDDFAKLVGDHDNLQALKDSIKTTLTEQEQKRTKEELKTRAMEKLVELNPIEVPQGLFLAQKKMIQEDSERRLTQQGLNPQDIQKYLQDNEAEYDKSSEFIIRSSYLISEIAKQKDLKADTASFRSFVAARAQEIGLPAEQLMSYYSNEDAKARVEFQILEEKVMEYVLELANITDVSKDQLK